MHLVVNDMFLLSQMSLLLLTDLLFNINVAICICLLLIIVCTNTNTPLNLAVMALEGYIAVCFPLRHAQICSPLGFFLSRVFCVGDRVFRNPLLKEKRDASYIIFLVLVWFILFYTYFKILFAAKGASADAKKARNTVVLHGFQLLRACSPQLIYGLRDRTFRKLLLNVLPGYRVRDLRTLNESLVGRNSSALLITETFTTVVAKNVIVVVLCISINYINGTLVHTFTKHQLFRVNPRYILFIHLVLNDMIQLSISGLLVVIWYTFYTINVSFCCLLLVISICTSLNTPLNLACMAVECYVAVCFPMRYLQICTVKRTYILIGLIWGVSAISILPDIFLLVIVEPPSFFHARVICIRDMVFRSSIQKRNTSHIICLVVVWLTLFFTYFNVLFAAKAANADVKKARNTLLLHGFQLLLCMMTYIQPLLQAALLYLFPQHIYESLFALYVLIQVMPRFLSPIVYGVRDKKFRNYLSRYLMCEVIIKTKPNHHNHKAGF
ncbi:odorant receptor 131-2-like [Gadus morhua]|uniref:odorant receptor 131-2-like n=1 Tax=Gadus morhua TaxID=8049 RepID=UPI0011B5E356|nr:odorant receptor 131-2-like [Gadus morhua]